MIFKGINISCPHVSKFRGDVVNTSISLTVIDFLVQNYRYKSVAIQIPHDARLGAFCPAGIEPGNQPLRHRRDKYIIVAYNKLLLLSTAIEICVCLEYIAVLF